MTPLRSQRTTAAFTLLELLATLAIIATLLGVAMPTLQAFMSRTGGQRGIHSLRENLLHTRQLAMSSGEEVRWSTEPRNEALKALQSEGLVAQVVVGQIPVVFHPDGTATDALIELSTSNKTLVGTLLVIGSTGAILTADSSS